MKAGEREKLRQWTVRKKAKGRNGGGQTLGARTWRVVSIQQGSGNGCFPPSSLTSQILERSALQESKSFISGREDRGLAIVTKREN